MVDNSRFYNNSCDEYDIAIFSQWLISQGFLKAEGRADFRSTTSEFRKGSVTVQIESSYGMWALFVASSRQDNSQVRFNVEDVMTYLGEGNQTRIDPLSSIKFLQNSMAEVRHLLEGDANDLEKRIRALRVERENRVWPEAIAKPDI